MPIMRSTIRYSTQIKKIEFSCNNNGLNQQTSLDSVTNSNSLVAASAVPITTNKTRVSQFNSFQNLDVLLLFLNAHLFKENQ